jgi:hypothetical protein
MAVWHSSPRNKINTKTNLLDMERSNPVQAVESHGRMIVNLCKHTAGGIAAATEFLVS